MQPNNDNFISDEAYHKYLRYYDAGLAMQGMCANTHFSSTDYDKIARYSVRQADALIKALNVNKQ